MPRPSARHRLQAIRDILAREPIGDQATLQQRLAAAGHAVTQSSVSRDLKELRVAKVDGRYALAESLPAPPPGTPGASPTAAAGNGLAALTMITGVAPAGPNLLVIRTHVGSASLVGLAIDDAGWPEVVGTIAGDDTVFAATPDATAQRRLRRRLEPPAGAAPRRASSSASRSA